jgi:hypothetical protein
MPATKYELRNGTGTRFMFPEVNVDDIRNNAVIGGNSGGSFSTTTVPNVTQSYNRIEPSIGSCASFGGCEGIVQSLNKALKKCNLNLEDCTTQYIELAEEYGIVVEKNAILEQEITDLENASAGLFGCSSIFFDDNNYNTVSGNVCVSSREDGKIDIIWSLTSRSTPTDGGGASGTYSFRGTIFNANKGVVGTVNSTNGPYCPYQRSTPDTFIKSANGTGVSGGVIHPTASYIDWYVVNYNVVAGRSYL